MRTLVLVLAVVFFAAPADAQFRRTPKFAEKGDLALVAQVRGLSLEAFDPSLGGLGLRYRLADQTVLGVGFGASVYDADGQQPLSDGETAVSESANTSLSGSLWLEQHVGSPRRTVSPFVGGGVMVGYGDQSNRFPRQIQRCNEASECTVEIVDEVRESTRVSVQGGLILGAEVRLAKGVTLGGAYTLGVGYTWQDYLNTSNRNGNGPVTTKASSDVLSVGTSSSGLTLSVYF